MALVPSCRSTGVAMAFLVLSVAPYLAQGRQVPEPESAGTPLANPRSATAAIELEGYTDEPDWATATPIGPLIQSEPVSGRPSTERTDVRLVFDEQALYIGVVCEEIHPHGLIATQLSRDANLAVDD